MTDFAPLSSVSELEILTMEATSIRDLEPLRSLTNLRSLFLNECDRLTDLRPIGDLPRLEVLNLTRAAPGLDLSPLAANRKLIVHIAAGQDVRGAEALGRRLKVS